jgi:hypothetical protein
MLSVLIIMMGAHYPTRRADASKPLTSRSCLRPQKGRLTLILINTGLRYLASGIAEHDHSPTSTPFGRTQVNSRALKRPPRTPSRLCRMASASDGPAGHQSCGSSADSERFQEREQLVVWSEATRNYGDSALYRSMFEQRSEARSRASPSFMPSRSFPLRRADTPSGATYCCSRPVQL